MLQALRASDSESASLLPASRVREPRREAISAARRYPRRGEAISAARRGDIRGAARRYPRRGEAISAARRGDIRGAARRYPRRGEARVPEARGLAAAPRPTLGGGGGRPALSPLRRLERSRVAVMLQSCCSRVAVVLQSCCTTRLERLRNAVELVCSVAASGNKQRLLHARARERGSTATELTRPPPCRRRAAAVRDGRAVARLGHHWACLRLAAPASTQLSSLSSSQGLGGT
jgi:hypothetical protein